MSRWKKVAVSRSPCEWVMLASCPLRSWAKLREAVDKGDYFMAQRRTGPSAFELLVTQARKVKTHV